MLNQIAGASPEIPCGPAIENNDLRRTEEGYAQAKVALRINPLCFQAHIEKQFAGEDAPEPAYLGNVFINYTELDPDLYRLIERLDKQDTR